MSEDRAMFNWGGCVINTSWVNQNSNESKLKLMEDLKRRNIQLVDLSYSNTIIISA